MTVTELLGNHHESPTEIRLKLSPASLKRLSAHSTNSIETLS
jgi:hypothetical protein